MKYLLLLLKGILTLGLIYFAVKDLDFKQTWQIIYSIKGLSLISIGIFLVLIQTILAGFRLKEILRLFKYRIDAFTGISLWFLGNFFSQFMISFIGGDTMRVISLTRSGIPAGMAVKAIFLDRVLGFIAIQILFLSFSPFLLNIIESDSLYWGTLLLALISISMIAGFILLGFIPKNIFPNRFLQKLLDIGAISKYLYISKFSTLKSLAISVIIQTCNIVAIYLLCNLLGGQLSVAYAFAIGSAVMLLSMMPISIGGWGVRESSMVFGLGLIKVAPDIALSISLLMGTSLLLGSLPGAFAMFKKYGSVELIEVVSII